jgi:hypothetical protein
MMKVALAVIPGRGHMSHLMDIVTRLAEGKNHKYITGSGAKPATRRRVLIFRTESGVSPIPWPEAKVKRVKEDGEKRRQILESAEEESSDNNSKDTNKSPRKRKAGTDSSGDNSISPASNSDSASSTGISQKKKPGRKRKGANSTSPASDEDKFPSSSVFNGNIDESAFLDQALLNPPYLYDGLVRERNRTVSNDFDLLNLFETTDDEDIIPELKFPDNATDEQIDSILNLCSTITKENNPAAGNIKSEPNKLENISNIEEVIATKPPTYTGVKRFLSLRESSLGAPGLGREVSNSSTYSFGRESSGSRSKEDNNAINALLGRELSGLSVFEEDLFEGEKVASKYSFAFGRECSWQEVEQLSSQFPSRENSLSANNIHERGPYSDGIVFDLSKYTS